MKKKALLNKSDEILGIVEVPETQKTIQTCRGYTIKRTIVYNSAVYKTEKNPVFEALNQDVFDGVETTYAEINDKPLDLKEMRLSSAKKYINSKEFLEADYLRVDENGIVNLC